jgi:glycosyltransferase involved in cell wall biosynthesis
LRLAVVSPFVDRRHGTERALAELLEILSTNYGCHIHLYAQQVEGLKLSPPQFVNSADSGSITWRKIPFVGGPHLLRFIIWMFLNTFCRFWDQAIGRVRFDFVLSPGINCLDADLVIVHAVFRRLMELSAHEESPGPALRRLRRWHRNAYYSFLAALERRIYSNPAVSLCTVSERSKKLLTSYFQRQDIVVIPNAVDPTEFSPASRVKKRSIARNCRGFEESDFVLLLIGNDWQVKGLPCVMKAMKATSTRSLHLLVVGNENPSRYLEQARQLGIAEQMRFEPSEQNALELYAAADLYVSPSLEDSFGLPVLEAMACGLPVISSRLAGVSELVSNEIDGFVLTDPQDAHELATILNRVIDNPILRNRIEAAARVRAVSCNWERTAADVLMLLDLRAAKRSSRGF